MRSHSESETEEQTYRMNTGKALHTLLAVVTTGLLVGGGVLTAGGPINSVGTTPTIYKSHRFPLAYFTDQGALGTFSNQEAVAIANFAFGEWEGVATTSLEFYNSGNLDHDVTSATDPLIASVESFTDGVFPVIFDHDGSITDARIGVGANQQVYGFATSFTPDGTEYLEGMVIINGRLTTRPDVEPVYREVITHEIGHMLGIDHSQVGMGANFSLMYPSVLTNINNLGFDPDDVASISLLYPAPGYLASVGSISGTVTNAEGAPLSDINVVAVRVDDGSTFTTISDYFSGPSNRYRNRPAAAGAFRFDGLPPGEYYVKIEPVKSNFVSGSSISGYDPPINTDTYQEWYNGDAEHGNILLDNGNEKSAVTVTAGNLTGEVDVVANSSPTLSEATDYNGSPGLLFQLPYQISNALISKLASQYTAPSNGSLVGVRLWVSPDSELPADGTLIVSVYSDKQESLAGIPDDPIGSVSVPLNHLQADQDNEIWLREIGAGINFLKDQKFHIGIEVQGEGMLVTLMDDGVGTENRSSYFVQENQSWRNFPDGLTGAEGWNFRMTAIYSSVPFGTPTPIITLSPNGLAFGRQRVGREVTDQVVARNVGTAPLSVTQTLLSGAGRDSYRVISGGAPFTIEPGASRTIEVGFTPTSTATATAILNLMHNAEGSPAVVNLSGFGKEPVLTVVSSGYDFGERPLEENSIEEILLLRNTGIDSLRILGMELDAPDGGFSLITQGGPAWVAPNLTYRARVRFRPTESREYTGKLLVSHELDGSPLEVSLVGIGSSDTTNSVGTSLVTRAFRLDFTGVQPNPLVGEGYLLFEGYGTGTVDAKIMVVDVRGRTLQSRPERIELSRAGTPAALPINLEGLPSGVYSVVVHTRHGTLTRRVVVRR